MTIHTAVLLVLGIGLLLYGAELLVRGASRLAVALGVSPLVIGLTVVSWGTSAPEVAVGVKAALASQVDVALGNVVGSNICNVLLILGLSAAVAPLLVDRQLVRHDVPLMIGFTALLYALGLDGRVSRGDGMLLLVFGVAYTVYSVALSRAAGESPDQVAADGSRWPADVLRVLLGLGLLVVGAHWLVDSAVAVAAAFGVDQLVIGLTVVAVGTSLPELATSVVAAARGERGIAIGNVVGSNLFNILGALPACAVVAPNGLPVPATVMQFDLPVALAAAVACLPVFFTWFRITRWEGVLFLTYYVAYVVFLVLRATNDPALPELSAAMVCFVVPLTLLGMAAAVAHFARLHREGRWSG